jgi:molybdenum cofactor biosynthesis enzyme MoaA
VDVRFIEYMPFTGNKWEFNKMVAYKDMVTTIKKEFPNFHSLENGPNDTSKVKTSVNKLGTFVIWIFFRPGKFQIIKGKSVS